MKFRFLNILTRSFRNKIPRIFSFARTLSSKSVPLAAFLTSLTVLLTIPNGFYTYIRSHWWFEDISVRQIDTSGQTVLYNAGLIDVFLDRIETTFPAGNIENFYYVGQVIPAKSYYVYKFDHIPYLKSFAGTVVELIDPLTTRLSESYRSILMDENHPILKRMTVGQNKITDYPGEVRFLLEANGERKTLKKSGRVFIVLPIPLSK